MVVIYIGYWKYDFVYIIYSLDCSINMKYLYNLFEILQKGNLSNLQNLYIDSIYIFIFSIIDNGILTDVAVSKLKDSLSHTCTFLQNLWITCIYLLFI